MKAVIVLENEAKNPCQIQDKQINNPVLNLANEAPEQASIADNSALTSESFNQGSASEQFCFRNLQNRHRKQSGVQSGGRRSVARTNTLPNQIDYSGRYRLEIDSRTDTMCCGKGFIPVSEIDQVCDVLGFYPEIAPIKDVPIHTCATAFDHPDGETVILVFGQALYLGDAMEHSLLSPNQVPSFNHQLCLNLKQFTNGTSVHGILVESEDTVLSFNMYGCISYLPIRTPTPDELQRCCRIILTSEEMWNPYLETFHISENSYLPPHHRTAGATSSKEHRSSIPAETLAQRWGASVDIASRTLKITTQRGIRNILSPLTRCFCTRQTQLWYPHLCTDVYSNTMFSDTKSCRGFTCAQLFVTDQDFADLFPMRSKSDAPYKLDLFCKTHGLPWILITDNAPEETKGEWDKVAKQYLLSQRTTEPKSGWQNRAEIEIRELKKPYRRIMHRTRCPEAFIGTA
jgi:hypothetical protein